MQMKGLDRGVVERQAWGKSPFRWGAEELVVKKGPYLRSEGGGERVSGRSNWEKIPLGSQQR